jgi:hypothetical protein
MPLSQQHRPALAAILVAVVAVLFATLAGSPAKAATPPSNPILDRALLDLGSYQGECWTWMKEVVLEATGRTVGFDYRDGFLEAGAVEVSLLAAGPGDIIQIVDDAWTTPDADYPGLHTAIIVSAHGDGTFGAIDSNQNFDGVVRLRPGYDPAALSAARGLNFHIYRLSGVSSAAPAPPPLDPGQAARVNTPGDCLRLRSAPAGNIVRCISHGISVSITGSASVVDGIAWVPVSTPFGKGWMAQDFLAKDPAAAANPTSGGDVKPVRPFRAFVTIAAD